MPNCSLARPSHPDKARKFESASECTQSFMEKTNNTSRGRFGRCTRLRREAPMRNLLRAHSAQLRVQLIAWPRFRAGGRCTVTNSIGRAVTGTRPGKHMHLPVQVLSNVVGDPPRHHSPRASAVSPLSATPDESRHGHGANRGGGGSAVRNCRRSPVTPRSAVAVSTADAEVLTPPTAEPICCCA
jgi:hypothetical protein